MTEEKILKAFNGRWRIKGKYIESGIIQCNSDGVTESIKSLCRDFFEAGILLAERSVVSGSSADQSPAIPMPAITQAAEESSFSEWWDLYDLKCGKENCMKKWKKLTASEKIDCIKATPAYVASTPDKQFRKRPLTYLNQKAWNDEIIYRNNGANKPTINEQRTDKLASILTD